MSQPERRRSRRVKIGQLLKVRPSGPQDEHFEDICKTINASPKGLYFITRRDSYYAGMRLFVTLPYREYLGQVVRIEQLENGRRGVAVQILSSVDLNAPANLAGAKRE